MAKSKKWICAKKVEAFKTKNLSQSGMFFTAGARMAFTKLRQTFIEAPTLNHFDSKRHIQIEMDTLSYAIDKILSQLTLNVLGQWHPGVFFSRKMIPVKT